MNCVRCGREIEPGEEVSLVIGPDMRGIYCAACLPLPELIFVEEPDSPNPSSD